jgi:mannose-6-phosphate isomerase-like protein (cupin superfamily)
LIPGPACWLHFFSGDEGKAPPASTRLDENTSRCGSSGMSTLHGTRAGRKTIVIRPDEGRVLHAFGDTVQLKLSGEETGGLFAFGLGGTPVGGGPPPHIHHRADELFIVVEGSFRFLGDNGWSEPIGPGGIAYTPRGVRHTFQCVSTTPGKHWVLETPSGFEKFLADCAAIFAAGHPPDMKRILEISKQHHLEFVPPLLT